MYKQFSVYRGTIAALVCILAIGACVLRDNGAEPYGSSSTPGQAPEPAPTTMVSDPIELKGARPSPSIDIQAIIERAHFAFRPDPVNGFTASHGTYRAHVDRTSVRLVPARHAAPLTIAGASLSRGGRALSASPGSTPKIAEDGRVTIDRGAFREDLRGTALGVEQTWYFSTKPAGKGDLVVRAGVSGEVYLRKTAGGLHFVDRVGGAGVCYGHATWIDAHGRRTHIEANFDGGAIVLRVPGTVVESSTYPAVLDPLIGPETEVDAPALGPTTRGSMDPAIGFDGAQFMIVWSDSRNWSLETDIWAARVSMAGILLDPTGFRVSSSGKAQRPAIAFGASRYLVSWMDSVNGGFNLVVARVDTSGSVIDTGGLSLSSSGDEVEPAVAYGGGTFLTVWRGNSGVKAKRLDETTGMFDALPIDVHPSGSKPAVAWDGAKFRVVWRDTQTILSKRLNASTGAPDANPVQVSPFLAEQPAIVCGPVHCLIVYAVLLQDAITGDNRFDIWGERFDQNNQNPDPDVLVISSAVDDQQSPAVAFDGANYLVTWLDSRNTPGNPQSDTYLDVYASLISEAEGAVLNPNGIPIRTDNGPSIVHDGRTSIAFDGTGYLVAWPDHRSGTTVSNIYAARVSPVPSVLSEILVSSQAHEEQEPAVASDGTGYMIVWRAYVSEAQRSDLFAVIADASGNVLTDPPIVVAASAGYQATPGIAWNGSHYLIAWADTLNGISFARYTSSGVLEGPASTSIAAGPGVNWPTVASDGSGFLIAWSKSNGIHAGLVDPNGNVQSADIALSLTTNTQMYPVAAFDGGKYVVAWEEWPNPGGPTTADIHAVRLSSDGMVDALIDVSIEANGQRRPGMACSQGTCVITWLDWRNGTGDLYMTRLDGGAVSDAAGTSLASNVVPSNVLGSQLAVPTVGTDGTMFLVAWPEQRPVTGFDLRGTWISPEGELLTPMGQTLSEQPTDEGGPRLASAGPGQFLLGYQRFIDDQKSSSIRVQLRTIQAKAPGDTCATDMECATMHCVDGVCCRTACDGACEACDVAGSKGTCVMSNDQGCGGGGGGGSGSSSSSGSSASGAGGDTGGADGESTSFFACSATRGSGGTGAVFAVLLSVLGVMRRRLLRRIPVTRGDDHA